MSNNRDAELPMVGVDAYVFDTLMHDLIGHDRAPSAFVVYLHLWRHTLAMDSPSVRMSLRDIAEGTGLSKRGVQEALTILARRRLVGVARQGITDIPEYTVKQPWRRAAQGKPKSD
jgi:DNA-binding GntR family transcriptional regulator